MKIEIKDVDGEGGYGLAANHDLYFTFENGNELILDKKSAFYIAWTLLDSFDMLDYDVENFMYEVQERVEENSETEEEEDYE